MVDTRPSVPIADGAYGIVWLAADAPQKEISKFWRDREVIPW